MEGAPPGEHSHVALMTILSHQSIMRVVRSGELGIAPFNPEHVGPAGYDVTLGECVHLKAGAHRLATSVEYIRMPLMLRGVLHGRSSVARMFVMTHVVSGPLEPAWEGEITFELVNLDDEDHHFHVGDRIAQIEFAWLDLPTDKPYGGRYQNQRGATASRFAHGDD